MTLPRSLAKAVFESENSLSRKSTFIFGSPRPLRATYRGSDVARLARWHIRIAQRPRISLQLLQTSNTNIKRCNMSTTKGTDSEPSIDPELQQLFQRFYDNYPPRYRDDTWYLTMVRPASAFPISVNCAGTPGLLPSLPVTMPSHPPPLTTLPPHLSANNSGLRPHRPWRPLAHRPSLHLPDNLPLPTPTPCLQPPPLHSHENLHLNRHRPRARRLLRPRLRGAAHWPRHTHNHRSRRHHFQPKHGSRRHELHPRKRLSAAPLPARFTAYRGADGTAWRGDHAYGETNYLRLVFGGF